MRRSKQETAATRVRIVEAASGEFRRNGIASTGLNELMAAAGMTHGGFYRHFASKDQVVTEACAVAVDSVMAQIVEAVARGDQENRLGSAVNRYLSASQRDNPPVSCPLATLGSELARCDEATRAVATEGFLKLAEMFGSMVSDASVGEARRKGLVAVSMMVGALTISRIVNDRKLSNAILREVKQAIL